MFSFGVPSWFDKKSYTPLRKNNRSAFLHEKNQANEISSDRSRIQDETFPSNPVFLTPSPSAHSLATHSIPILKPVVPDKNTDS